MDWDFLIKGKDSICVSTDTRNLPSGCVFVALRGANFNGNRFAMQALEMGAEYAVIDEDIAATCSQKSCFDSKLIRVDNCLLALQDLARTWRRQWGKIIIGITGTNGKTTTKELTAAVLSTHYNVLYTEGNLNNQVGVPLTLLRLTADNDLAIIEMGASHRGDIKELVEIAEPDCGLITNVGKAHLQGFGSFEGVQATKGELYDYLALHHGYCFRNLDNPYLERMAGSLPTVGYHTGVMPPNTHLVGSYNAENISAAICVGMHFGIAEEEARRAIESYQPTNNRSQLLQTKRNTVIIDAYNANPTSMQAAIVSFIDSYREQDMAFILGQMLELGDYSHTAHQNIVNMLLEQKIDNVYLIGNEFAATTSPYRVFATTDDLKHYLQQNPLQGKTILLKGSRGNKLEEVVEVV